MKENRIDLEKLKGVLAEVYRQVEPPKMDGDWTRRVMARVRSLPPPKSGQTYLEILGGILWRLAPMVCLLLLVFSYGIARSGLVPDLETIRMLSEEVGDFVLFRSLGL